MKLDNRETQLRAVYNAFYEEPRTMKEVFIHTGVLREFVCWYCRELRLNNSLFFVKKRRCTITNQLVNEYSTNEDFKPIQSQLELFN